MEREKFGTRLGFILVSAGCAIGLGNVWRFPYITGEYGGAAFVIMYLVFLAIFALPALIMEFAARPRQASAPLRAATTCLSRRARNGMRSSGWRLPATTCS